jgi:hypothetical protein
LLVRFHLRTAALAATLLAFLGFGLAVAALLQSPKRGVHDPAGAVSGALFVESLERFRVEKQRVRLCGVRPALDASFRAQAIQAIKAEYEGQYVSCRQVGNGTPCDGKEPPRSPDSWVAQSHLHDGLDLASELVKAGCVCGRPERSGDAYQPCPDIL